MSEYLLEMKGICRLFPGGVVANKEVDFAVRAGEIHALLGENGAGKSTLMNIAFGLFRASSGEMRIRGKEVRFRSSAEAMACGIGMVHQHFMLVPCFSVVENIVLGHEPGGWWRGLSYPVARRRVEELSRRYGLQVEVDVPVEALSVGEQQRVEIIKALYRRVDLLILDEPTAVLTPQETEELFQTLRELVAGGLTVIFISHKLREVKAISDRFTVLRRGERVATGETAAYSLEELAELMVGRPLRQARSVEPATGGAAELEIRGLVVEGGRSRRALEEISLTVHRGEIVGIAGVEGNGQAELVEAIAGLRSLVEGEIVLGGRSMKGLTPRQRLEAGLAYLPEDRQRRGLVLDDPLELNLILGRHFESEVSGRWLLQQRAIRVEAQKKLDLFAVVPAAPQALARSLSGGNQQKVVVAREFTRQASFFLIAQPTRGVDVGAIELIHEEILKLQHQGKAILLLSAELPELLALCNRILVLYEGRIAGELPAEEASEARLGVWMTGGSLELSEKVSTLPSSLREGELPGRGL